MNDDIKDKIGYIPEEQRLCKKLIILGPLKYLAALNGRWVDNNRGEEGL